MFALSHDSNNFKIELPFKHILTELYWALIPLSHPLASQDEISFEDLIQNRMILYKDPCDIRTSFRAMCNSKGLVPAIGMELEFNDSIHSFVANNQGVSIVPENGCTTSTSFLLSNKTYKIISPILSYCGHGISALFRKRTF